VICMEECGHLAIEHDKGLSIVRDWQQKKVDVRHHLVAGKTSFGCISLSNSKTFILNNNLSNIEMIHEEDLSEVITSSCR